MSSCLSAKIPYNYTAGPLFSGNFSNGPGQVINISTSDITIAPKKKSPNLNQKLGRVQGTPPNLGLEAQPLKITIRNYKTFPQLVLLRIRFISVIFYVFL